MLLFCVDCKRGGWVGTIPEMVKRGGRNKRGVAQKNVKMLKRGGRNKRGLVFFVV